MRFFLICMMSIFLINIVKALPLDKLTLPPGFTIEIYAQVPNARQMALGSNNTIFVGSMQGKVYAVSTHKRETTPVVTTIASGLNMPTGVAFHDGSLYVAAVDRILRFDNIEKNLDFVPKPVVIKYLPKFTHHGWRFIRFGPDNKLYISIGTPCNTCITKDPIFGTISRMQPNGDQFEIYAKGIRNSLGFDWDPKTNYLWFTENGRDWLGDNLPPDEINYAPHAGLNFGFPSCYGKNIPDLIYGKHNCKNYTPSTYDLPAHVAALGMSFYTGKQFPAAFQQQLFIAEHGSWNRSKKIGYQVIVATLSEDRKSIQDVKPLVTGWLDNESVWGRPVDVLNLPDGTLLISDDYASVIYRVRYKK